MVGSFYIGAVAEGGGELHTNPCPRGRLPFAAPPVIRQRRPFVLVAGVKSSETPRLDGTLWSSMPRGCARLACSPAVGTRRTPD